MAIIARPPLFSRIEKGRTPLTFVGGLEFNINQRIPLISKCAFQNDAFQTDAFQLCAAATGFSDAAGAAVGDAIASGEGSSTVFPFAHLSQFHAFRRAKCIVTLEQWQNPTLAIRYNSDGAGTAAGDAIASAEGTSLADATATATGDATASGAGDSTVFPFAHQSQFDVVRRAKRIVTLEQWQTLATLRGPQASFGDSDGTATGDAIASAVGISDADASGAASGDATASASDGSTFFPFAHQSQFDVVRRARRIVTIEQWQNPTLLGLRRNSDADGAASGDATASASGASDVFPFAKEQIFWAWPRRHSRGLCLLETWQNVLAAHTTVAFSQADGTAIGDANASAEGASLASGVGAASGDAIASGAGEAVIDAAGTAQGGSEATAVGRRSKRVKLVQGTEQARLAAAFYEAARRRGEFAAFDHDAFQPNAFQTVSIEAHQGHFTISGGPGSVRGVASMSKKSGSASYPIRRGRAELNE